MDHAWKLKFISFVHLPSINKIFCNSLRLSDSVQCRRGQYFLAWVLYFSFGTHKDVKIKQLCSSSMYKQNLYIWSCLGDYINFQFLGPGALYLRFKMC